eukprot:1849922-Pyramimonas_sp.AAC.1
MVSKAEGGIVKKEVNFIGREAKLQLGCYKGVVDIVLAENPTTKKRHQQYGLVLAVFAAFVAFWTKLTQPWLDDRDETRRVRSEELRELGVTYIWALLDCAGARAGTTY